MVMSVPQTIRAYRWGNGRSPALTWWTIAVAISMVGMELHLSRSFSSSRNIASLTATAAMLVVLTHPSVERWVVPAFVVVGTFAELVVAAASVCAAHHGSLRLRPVCRSRAVSHNCAIGSSYRAGSPTSVSRTTWMLAATGQSGWLIYGLILGDPASSRSIRSVWRWRSHSSWPMLRILGTGRVAKEGCRSSPDAWASG